MENSLKKKNIRYLKCLISSGQLLQRAQWNIIPAAPLAGQSGNIWDCR